MNKGLECTPRGVLCRSIGSGKLGSYTLASDHWDLFILDGKGENAIMEMHGVQPGPGAPYCVSSASPIRRPTMITRLDIIGPLDLPQSMDSLPLLIE